MKFRDLDIQYQTLKTQIDAGIQEVLNDSCFIMGKQVDLLEKKLADYVERKYCVCVANGTDAISIAMKVWGIGMGDAVFVPDFTFFSSGECPAAEGATPIFVDVDKNTYNIDPIKLEEAIKDVMAEGKYNPKAVIAVDLFGLPADYMKIKKICNKYDMLLMEDAAQGFGGNINGKMACSFGDISTTSFFPSKPLGCYGDGGAIFTDNDEWADLIKSLCVHGKDTSEHQNENAKYNNIRIGMNSRLDTLQAAILLPKFEAFKRYELKQINKVASWYTEGFSGSDIITPIIKEGFYSSWAQYTIQLPEKADRKAIQNKLREVEIPSMVYYVTPMHRQRAFNETDSAKADCPVTECLCRTVLSLPIDPYKTKEEIDLVVREVINAL